MAGGLASAPPKQVSPSLAHRVAPEASAGVVRHPLEARLAMGALVATAVHDLWRYQVRARLRGGSVTEAAAVLQRWSRRAWPLLGLDVHVDGRVPEGAHVYVANHRSYLDIPVLSGVLGGAFVSRADVARWPIVGSAARAVGSVFVERADPGARVAAARALLRRLAAGSVIVFPEGTTGGERLPGAFHAGLFRLLHRHGASVVPVTVRYGSRRAYWIEDLTLGRHLRERVLAGASIPVTVHVGAACKSHHAEHLARAASDAVAEPIGRLGELVR